MAGVGWSHYGGSNPHDHHLHLSIRHESRYEDDGREWKLPMLGYPASPPPPPPPPPPPAPAFPSTPLPVQKDDDMPGYLFSDGGQVWLTDGVSKRRVSFNGDRFRELVFLGQARNSVDSGGNIDIPTNPAYLAEIPVES